MSKDEKMRPSKVDREALRELMTMMKTLDGRLELFKTILDPLAGDCTIDMVCDYLEDVFKKHDQVPTPGVKMPWAANVAWSIFRLQTAVAQIEGKLVAAGMLTDGQCKFHGVGGGGTDPNDPERPPAFPPE